MTRELAAMYALTFGGFLPPIVMGLIYQATGSYAIGLMLLAAVAAAALVYCWFVLRSPRIARLTQEEGI
ncbi:hypothetical protein [Microbispora sp. NBRC 16548]|uniref:hypothetical protein n=1 Tax=Microbispora sp. NBRC 16548 TaxID=3030994 RepID=UPI001842747B|nr:hypothetical protein [Microbispora sp. NBRC 16548]GLX10214.1 hypothetical protein Misp03_71400 [Microbispora sp. NBRC 16548]